MLAADGQLTVLLWSFLTETQIQASWSNAWYIRTLTPKKEVHGLYIKRIEQVSSKKKDWTRLGSTEAERNYILVKGVIYFKYMVFTTTPYCWNSNRKGSKAKSNFILATNKQLTTPMREITIREINMFKPLPSVQNPVDLIIALPWTQLLEKARSHYH